MKTKEQVIKEAWGIHFNCIGDKNREHCLKNDGWIITDMSDIDIEEVSNPKYDSKFECYHFDEWFYKIRPKSLQGIEDNNGWIRIESKDDLPIDNGGSYMVCEKGIPREEYQMPRESLAKGWSCGVITHYKPIVKHKKPLY
ncbi:hypothetical protein ACKUSY_05510 [Myroides odoratus]|uniref:Uncharacterized protein n=1 Tax=Myroides odoratus TaxID=256 RepID=A0A378RPW9_MYROD|nr:hypothetical protein [Myroides odoratus]QQU04252.1 hypothetical protein I6I89_02925 [Myroides odoratus]STZ28331.1 Uncharacterised protein [Myroides odoratus]